MKAVRPDEIDTAKTPIVDVRLRPGKQQIAGALRYDPACLLRATPLVLPFAHDSTIAVYGDSDSVVDATVRKLHESGYGDAAPLQGGIEAWHDAGLPLEETSLEQPVPASGL